MKPFKRVRQDGSFGNRLVNISKEKQTQVNREMDGSVINHRWRDGGNTFVYNIQQVKRLKGL